MNIRKPNDYSALDVLMGSDLTEMELYCEIGRAVCGRTEKGAAVMAAEYLQSRYPERKGFSPRNLRRMRLFYLTYGNTPDRLEKALKLAWTQNVTILEACEAAEERAWYLNAALEHGWGKTELLRQIQNGAWGLHWLDEPEDICYTEEKETVTECGEREKDTFYLPRQYLPQPNGGICISRNGAEGRPGTGLRGTKRGAERRRAWQPGIPACPRHAGAARHLVRG